MKKKLTAIIALMAMMITLLPMAAFADDSTTTNSNISINIIEFNNDMTREQVVVSISGSGLQNGMPVYWTINGVSTQLNQLGIIYNGTGQNNFYIDKEDIPNIEDPYVGSTITVSVMNTALNAFVASQTANKSMKATAPERMQVTIDDTQDGVSDRTFTVKFDPAYVPGSDDVIIFQGLNANGTAIRNDVEEITVTSAALASNEADSDGMRAMTNTRLLAMDFASTAESVRVTFERDGEVMDEFTTVLPLESIYGTYASLALEFASGDSIAQGATTDGTLYYVNTKGERYDITDSVSSFFCLDADGVVEEPSSTTSLITHDGLDFTISKDAEIGSTIQISTIYNGHSVSKTLTVVSPDPGDVKISSKSAVAGVQTSLTFTLVDEDGDEMTLDFVPTSVSVRWIDSSDEDATLRVVAGSVANLNKDGAFLAAVTGSVPCTGKMEITLTDGKGNVYQAVSDTFTFTDPNATTQPEKISLTISSTVMRVDGKTVTMDVAPLIQNNRTYVPLRAVGESMGADVDYNATTSRITIELDDTLIVMTPGSTGYTVNGTTRTMDVAPYIVAEAGRAMVPFRVIGEALGYQVDAISNADGTTAGVEFTLK